MMIDRRICHVFEQHSVPDAETLPFTYLTHQARWPTTESNQLPIEENKSNEIHIEVPLTNNQSPAMVTNTQLPAMLVKQTVPVFFNYLQCCAPFFLCYC